MSGLPPLNWLRAFEASARNLSFTGAARDLNMTQSAVSQQIKSLESYLGRPLFHRRVRALELTQTGLSYLPVVREAFRTLERGTNALTRNEKNVLRVQSNLSFAIHWLAPRLPSFRARFPQINLSITTDIWEPNDMPDATDVEIRFSLHPSDQVNAELLARDHFYPVCHPKERIALEDLHKKQLYDCSNMMGTWRSWAEEQGMDWPDTPVTYATTYSVALSAAKAGGAFALAHDIIAGKMIEDGELIAPFAHRSEMKESYYLIQTPKSQSIPAAQAFTTWLRETLSL